MIPVDVIQANAAPTAATGTGSSELGREDFLTMLVAQLENQDPLNPQDGTEFTAQLAQFSSLEQLLGMRESIDALAAVQTQAQTLGAVSLIGKKVLVEGNRFEIPAAGGELPNLSFELSQPADIAKITLLNEQGSTVTTLSGVGQKEAGTNTLDLADFGVSLSPGIYEFRVEVADGSEGAFVREHVESRVTGTAIQQGTLYLGGVSTRLEDVKEVRE